MYISWITKSEYCGFKSILHNIIGYLKNAFAVGAITSCVFLLLLFASRNYFSLEQLINADWTLGIPGEFNTRVNGKYCLTYEPNAGRLGNQMFSYGSTLGLSITNDMHFVFPAGQGREIQHLQKVFKLDGITMNNSRTCRGQYYLPVTEGGWARRYVDRFTIKRNESVRVDGYLQSHRYFNHISDRVRKAFTFVYTLQRKADRFHQTIRKRHIIRTGRGLNRYIKVGIHVRLGDYRRFNPKGVRLAPDEYYIKAAEEFLKNYTRVVFIVATQPEEKDNVTKIFDDFDREHRNVKVVYAPLESAGEDLAILAACDHMIMSIGSFGWWAGWLTGGTVIYYDNWIREGTDYEKRLETEARFEDHYPPNWIPLH